MIKLEPKYDISQTVYHATPESPKGIVIDWQYNRRENCIVYRVAFDAVSHSIMYYEEELSETKIF